MYEERVPAEIKFLGDEIFALPKCQAGLTEGEAHWLHEVMGQFQKLRRNLLKTAASS